MSLLKRPSFQLAMTGLVSWCLYVVIAWLSRDFAYGTPGIDRPLLSVMALFGVVFVLYLLQVWLVLRSSGGAVIRSHRRETVEATGDSHALVSVATPKFEDVLPVIVVFAIAFRLLLLFSEPIQEVDAYRYLWDGQAVAAGVNPFRYSPQQVLNAEMNSDLPHALSRLVQIRDQSPAQAEILRRVHFGELTTVYPPVSQAVFALAAIVTPQSASLSTHLLVMKSFIVVFDLATLGLLVVLLRLAGRPVEWSILYAWCPLVMKEFANSGHLDAIAVFVTTAAFYCAVRGLYSRSMGPRPVTQDESPHGPGAHATGHQPGPILWLLAASLLLALGVGAKIYPAIFAPLLLLSIWRRAGFYTAAISGAVFATISAAMVLPMLTRDQDSPAAFADPSTVESALLAPEAPPVPNASPIEPEIDPTSTGLSAFAAQWQMNDFLFLLLFENLTPDRGPDSTQTAWFVVTPSNWRDQIVKSVSQSFGLAAERVPFLITRLVTTAFFGALALWWAWRGAAVTNATDWLMYAFLTVAWFWLLQPTQNPWYWTWALPLLPFARSRTWLLLSGLTLIYYLRFWCLYHAPETAMFGTPYAGIDFFDFVGSWIEFAPWFVLLGIEFSYRRTRMIPGTHPPDSTG